jgi:hypothetical protein
MAHLQLRVEPITIDWCSWREGDHCSWQWWD